MKASVFCCSIWVILIILVAKCFADKFCSEYMIKLGDYCYDPHLERGADFKVAKEICEEDGGQIALVSTPEIRKTLLRVSLKQRFENYWIKKNEGVESGGCQALKYQNGFQLSEEHCSNSMFYVCEFDFAVNNSTRYGLSYFQFSEDRLKFSDALESCKRLEGKLAEVTSEGRFDAIRNELNRDMIWGRFSDWQIENLLFGYEPHIWAGVSYDSKNKTWMSGFDTPVEAFSHLSPTGNSGDCLAFSWKSWKIRDCEEYNVFFCQYAVQENASVFEDIDMEALLWKNIIQITGLFVIIVYGIVNRLSREPQRSRNAEIRPKGFVTVCSASANDLSKKQK